MNKITTAIAIMDEKGRRMSDGKTIGLWEREWDNLRALLLTATAPNSDSGHTYCAFCGAEYPLGTPRHGDGLLTEHILTCPEHPMREVEHERDHLRKQLEAVDTDRQMCQVQLNRERTEVEQLRAALKRES